MLILGFMFPPISHPLDNITPHQSYMSTNKKNPILGGGLWKMFLA
tara:strand:- start:291 stop:425 length:135 start_codon:yes stop_codon:yes gene_type:complete